MLAVSELAVEGSLDKLLIRKKFLIFWPAVLLTLALVLRVWPEKLRFSLECGMLALWLAVRPVMGGDRWNEYKYGWVRRVVVWHREAAAKQSWTICLADSGVDCVQAAGVSL